MVQRAFLENLRQIEKETNMLSQKNFVKKELHMEHFQGVGLKSLKSALILVLTTQTKKLGVGGFAWIR